MHHSQMQHQFLSSHLPIEETKRRPCPLPPKRAEYSTITNPSNMRLNMKFVGRWRISVELRMGDPSLPLCKQKMYCLPTIARAWLCPVAHFHSCISVLFHLLHRLLNVAVEVTLSTRSRCQLPYMFFAESAPAIQLILRVCIVKLMLGNHVFN